MSATTISERPIRLGIIGLSTGGWGSGAHVPALTHPSLRSTFALSALQTSSADSAARAKEIYTKTWPNADGSDNTNLKTYYGEDTTSIANDPNVDVVAVSVKVPYHKAAIESAVAAGKHVFVEFPVGRTLSEAEEVRRSVERNGKVKVMVGLQGVFSPKLRKVKKIVESGKIGKIISTTVIANIPREIRVWQPEATEGNTYLLDRTNGATLLSIAAGHQLATLIHVLGRFSTVSATSSTRFPKVDIYSKSGDLVKTRNRTNAADHYTISGALESGAHASITWRSGTKTVPGRPQFLWIIDGEEGSIQFEAPDGSAPVPSMTSMYEPARVTVNGKPLDEYLEAEGIEYPSSGVAVEDGEKGMFIEFVRNAWVEFGKALRGEEAEYVTLDDAIDVHKVVDAVERSAELGGAGIKLN